jgi:hypothetical protein
MAKIDRFSFGSIVVDGTKHIRDVILLPDGKVKWRSNGFWVVGSHSIKKEEVEELIYSGAETIIIGVGVLSRARLSDKAEAYLRSRDVKLSVMPSRDAAKQFNQTVDGGQKAAALIHITC